MASELSKIIVKVGKKSSVKFSNSKVYRAIIADDLGKLAKAHDDCHIVIIESIKEKEEDTVKQFILDYKEKDDRNEVLFFIPDETDEITSGLADELDYNIYMTLNDLYKAIYSMFKVNVSIYLDDKRQLNSAELQESIPDDMVVFDPFAEINEDEQVESETEIKIEEVETTVAVDETVDVERELDSKTNVETESELEEAIEKTEVKKEADIDKSDEDKTQELKEISLALSKEDSSIEKTTAEFLKAIEKKHENEVKTLKEKIKSAEEEYDTLLADMQSANTQILTLEKVVDALKAEKRAMQERYDELFESKDVLEDPISLAEYEVLNETIDNLKSTVSSLERTIKNNKEEIEEKESDLEEKEESIKELKSSLERTKKQLSDINNSIETGEIHEEIIAEYKEKLSSLESDKQKLLEDIDNLSNETDTLIQKLSDTKSELEEKETSLAEKEAELLELKGELSRKEKEQQSEIDSLISAKQSELDTKKFELESKQSEINSKQSEINTLKEKVKTLNNELNAKNSIISNQTDKINALEEKTSILENSSDTEVQRLKSEISGLQTKLNITEQQLKQKESQYNQLVSTSGVDENGASALLETNRAFESVIRTLREQLGTTSKELETTKRHNSEMTAAIKNYQSQIKQLNEALKSMASVNLGNGSAGANLVGASAYMKPIKYTGQAQLIPVFGNGSFGITTTAMSLAYKLSATSKVLYLDFDLVNPKADAWFSKYPICQNVPGINRTDRRMTGLGIFYEKGLQTFETYFNNIVCTCDRTKGGGIDYISGVYYRVDNLKLTSADYGSLLDFLATKYQYIVIDLGRLGGNDVIDQLIKSMTDIANKSIVVTTSDKFDVRNFRTKIAENNINIERIAWLLNWCDSTNIDDKTKNVISPAKFGIILKDSSIQGSREKFTRNKLNKDKFELFINSVLFAK